MLSLHFAVAQLLASLQAFSILDKDASGIVTTAEMSQTYDVSANPAVQSGKATWSQRSPQLASLTTTTTTTSYYHPHPHQKHQRQEEYKNDKKQCQ